MGAKKKRKKKNRGKLLRRTHALLSNRWENAEGGKNATIYEEPEKGWGVGEGVKGWK